MTSPSRTDVWPVTDRDFLTSATHKPIFIFGSLITKSYCIRVYCHPGKASTYGAESELIGLSE